MDIDEIIKQFEENINKNRFGTLSFKKRETHIGWEYCYVDVQREFNSWVLCAKVNNIFEE
jgi:hypothetical protein